METNLEELIISTWDNWETIDTDYKLEDFGDILPLINKMPKLDLTILHYSQYTDKRYYTGCTIMSWINAISTMTNKVFSNADISSVYDLAESRWRVPWKWWSRSEGRYTAVKRWNTKYPTDKILMFEDKLFSESFNQVAEKLGIMWVSINVDWAYWNDARDNYKIDGSKYAIRTWHATCLMLNKSYSCVDSVCVRNDIRTPMIYQWWDKSKLESLIKNYNMRVDCTILIMEKRLNGISESERQRLTTMRSLLQVAIDTNNKLIVLTNSKIEKDERVKQNQYNESKIKVIDAMLW